MTTTSSSPKRSAWWKGGSSNYLGLVAVLVVLVAIFSGLSEYFFSRLTFQTIANQIPPLVVVSVGMTLVLAVAGIDLSVGSVLAFSSAVLGVVLVDGNGGLGLGIVACLLVGLGCGVFNGWVSVRWAIPSFIVTLGMLEIARGGAYLVTGSQTKYIGAAIAPLSAPIEGLGLSPAFFAAMVVVGAGHVLLTRTVFGRYMIAIGTNEQAVRLSGIDPRPVLVGVFALAGLLSGLGGVFQTAYLESADPNAGLGMELAAIAAVVIGGTSLMGGRASVVNSFFGVLIIVVLQTGLAQIGADEPTKRMITGGVIILAVIVDAYRHQMQGRPYPLLKRLLRRPS